MQNPTDVTTVAHVIQLAVAPVFLLTGIGAILNVITTRLARIVDRTRALINLIDQSESEYQEEKDKLARRTRWIHWAVSLCTASALFICVVIAVLFIGSVTGYDSSRTVSLLFISAMLMLICGLLCFLREIFLATDNLGMRQR